MNFLDTFISSVTGEQNGKLAKKTLWRFKFGKNTLVILKMLESQSTCDSNAQIAFYDNSLKAIFSNILENIKK